MILNQHVRTSLDLLYVNFRRLFLIGELRLISVLGLRNMISLELKESTLAP